MKLKHKKTTQDSGIPVKTLISLPNIFTYSLMKQLNHQFSSSLKQANITPVFKKGSRNQKENYRPVSILPIISKIFEKILSKQLYIYFQNILSKFQCGFRKGFSTQQ